MNLGEIRTAIQQLGYGTDTAAAQTTAVNAVDRRIQGKRRWSWNELSLTSVLSSGESELLYPSAAKELDTVQISSSTRDEYPPLEFAEYNEVNELLHTEPENTGTPRLWTVRGRTIYFWPVPESDWTVDIDYVRGHVPLVNDSDTPVIPGEYHDLYVNGGAALIAARQRDWSMVSLMKDGYDEMMREMIAAVGIRQRQNSRRVTDSGFFRSVNHYG